MQSTTGRYRCEVSAEAPSFATSSAFGDLLVVGMFKFFYTTYPKNFKIEICCFIRMKLKFIEAQQLDDSRFCKEKESSTPKTRFSEHDCQTLFVH